MMPEEFNKNYELALATQNWDYISPLVHENTSVSFTEGTFHSKSNVKHSKKHSH